VPIKKGTIFIDEELELSEFKQLETKQWLKFFDIRSVIVEVQPGETEEEAWSRHLKRRPEDRCANIRIFNRQPPKEANT
jgi:hypothetical protein